MKLKRLISFSSALVVSLSSLFVISVPHVFAAARTWDGGGSDDNFSTAANWSGDTAPGNGDSITIPYDVVFGGGCSSDVTLTNDLNASSVTLAGISFTGNEPSGCFNNVIIAGNALKTSGNILGNDVDDDSPRAQFHVDITATGAITIQSIASTGSLAIGSNNVTVNSASFDGGISGSGALTIDGYPGGSGGGGCSPTADPYPFAGDSSGFSGSVKSQSDGSMSVTKQTNDLARFASSLTKESDGFLGFSLDNGQDMSLSTPITFKGGTSYASQLYDGDCNAPASNKTVTLSGDITFTAETTFSLYNANIKFTGTVTGKDFVKVASGGSGTITFPDNSSASSELKVWTIDNTSDCSNYSLQPNNKTVVNVDCSSIIGSNAEFPTEVSGILGGSGKVGHVKILSGGEIAPGNSPGCLSTGNLTMVSGSTYDFEVGGTTECTEYDQIKVTGTVDLGSGTLNTVLYNGFKPKKDQSFKIIDNDGSDAVTGTFKDLPEGATFNVSGNVFKITYKGGDGNDVVLTVITAATPDTGFRLMKNSPVITLIATMFAAGGIVGITRRHNKAVSKR